MKIWIDPANSPQVLFFRLIIAELKRRGHDMIMTSRDFAQTLFTLLTFELWHNEFIKSGNQELLPKRRTINV